LLQGLSVDAASGIISGTPTSNGTSTVTVGAINASGVGQATLTLTIGATPPAPTGNYIVTPSGSMESFTLPADYTITGGPPINNFADYSLGAVKQSLNHVSVTSITTNNPALEAQRLQILQEVNKIELGIKTGKVKTVTLNFIGIITALFQLMSDVGKGNISNLGADFSALLAAFVGDPKSAVPCCGKEKLPMPMSDAPPIKNKTTRDVSLPARF
jgi:hypothetical protein